MIRPATEADAAAVAALHLRALLHAYGDIVDPDVLRSRSHDQDAWRRFIRAGDTVVFDVGGQVAGFASLGPCELRSLYVDPPAQGAGVGRALLGAAEDALRAQGCAAASLWVLEGNGLGRRFYERHGWRATADRRDGRFGVAVRYLRELDRRASFGEIAT